MRIALAQIVSGTDPQANLTLVAAAAKDAAAAGAAMVVLPEAAMCAFGVSLGPVAEPLDGPWANGLREIAAENDITVVAGMFTPGSDGRVRNTVLATGRGVEASYDKIHLFDAYGFRESTTVAAGRGPGHRRAGRRDDRADHLLRRPVPRAVPGAGRTGCDGDPAVRILGCRAGQAGAVGPADQGAGAGQHQLPAGRRAGRSRRR